MLSSQLCFSFPLPLPLPLHLFPFPFFFSERKLKKRKMELDLQNPLTVYEYDDVSSLFSNEFDHMPLLLPSESRLSIRRTALSLISQAKLSCGLDPFLVYLSVNYVDRFLSKQEILDKSPWIPHILFVASLSLAAKMTDSDSSLLLADLEREGGLKFEASSLHRMEKIILAALQWRMRSITPFSFLHYFLSLLNVTDSSSSRSLRNRASDIIFDVQNESKLLEYKPSTIAASALLCAVRDLSPLTFSSSESIISSCEYINKSAVSECVALMWAITEASESAATSCTVERQRTSSISEEGATPSTSSGFPETNNLKRRRLNGLCDSRTFQISQIQQC